MKLLPAILGLAILSGCAKKDAPEAVVTTDSAAVAEETVPVETVGESVATEEDTMEYFDGIPPGGFAEDHYADDEPIEIDSIGVFNLQIWPQVYTEPTETDEQAVVEATMALLQDYNKMTLSRVKRSYTRKDRAEYEDEGGGKYTTNTVEKGTEIWMYDSEGKIRVYTRVYRMNDDMDGFKYLKTIYLFKNDSIVAGYEDMDDAGQSATNSKLRFVVARCPSCGTYITNDTGSTPVYYNAFKKDGVDYAMAEYAKISEKVLRELKEGFPNAKLGSNGTKYKYTVTAKDEYPPVPYKANLEIGKSLYEKLFPQ